MSLVFQRLAEEVGNPIELRGVHDWVFPSVVEDIVNSTCEIMTNACDNARGNSMLIYSQNTFSIVCCEKIVELISDIEVYVPRRVIFQLRNFGVDIIV